MEEVLGYDCDENEIYEFRILRSPFSADIENWDEEPNVDPRFYCAILGSDNKYYAISVYDDYNSEYIRKFEQINDEEDIPTIVKPISDMSYYEVTFQGINNNEWYYDRDRGQLQNKLNNILNNKVICTKIMSKNKRLL